MLKNAQYLYVELMAAYDATLSLRDKKNARAYTFELARVAAGQELAAVEQQTRIEVLERHKVWLHYANAAHATSRTSRSPARCAEHARW
jgi:hypothetical protein